MTTNSGLLLLDKPQGLTSHDVVARVRKVTNERRVGHAGTLDPMATGLLVVAVGPSTRLLRFAQGEVKRYSGTVKFGVATASLDADGEVVEERPVPLLSSADAQLLARGMLGPQQQTPPMVSAIKVGGRRLHELARQGLEVEREARDITISDFSVSATGDPSVWEFEVECTVGTYVRVLLSDLAERAGTVGHLTSLRRVSSGGHHVEDALSLDELEALVVGGGSPFQAPLAFVESLERTTLSEDQERRMRMGQQIEIDGSFVSGEIVAVNARGAFAAILRRRGEKWKPEVVLPAESDRAQG
jgi:tRNA pseudouridine55 synthase